MVQHSRVISCLTFFIIGVIFATNGYAQSASATWVLTTDTGVVVVGDITASGQVLSSTAVTADTLTVKDFAGGAMASPVERLWLNGTSWPTQTAQDDGRYIQYSLSPSTGKNLMVQSITLNIGCYGTVGHLFANIYYSIDSTFSTRTQLNATALTLPDIRTVALMSLSYAPGITVNEGQSFYLRIYPWNNSSTPSATKYICLTNVVISGTTASTGVPLVRAYPDSLSFGNVKIDTSKEMTYSLYGTLLTPADGNITVKAPNGFQVSTTSGSGYSSSISIPYSGGILSSTIIYVTFTPTLASAYTGIITNTGGGDTTRNVSVSGTGVVSETVQKIFISPTGNDLDPGTYEKPFLTINKAISVAQAGDTIFMRGGRYSLNTKIGISQSGTASRRYFLFAYPGERPILDFSSMAVNSSNRGIELIGSYWYIKGLDIYKAGDNGMNISGSNNIVEFCALYENGDSGLQLSGGASNNRIINCDSYYNEDLGQGNADGFSPKLDVGTGNYFFGCRSWQNSDDGFDGYLRPSNDVTTTIENCWAFMNGYLKGGNAGSGNGNGFKMGGSDAKDLMHNMILKNCLAFDNLAKGFDQNHNKGSMTLYNCTGYNNGTYDYAISEALNSGKTLTLTNCLEFGNKLNIGTFAIQTTNSWQGFTVTDGDFVNRGGLDTAGVRGPRNADGSLPTISFMHLNPGSGLVNHGTDVGIPYLGPAPDIGCFETNMVTGAGFIAVPIAFDFGSIYIGQYKHDSLTVTNHGTIPLVIDSVVSTNSVFSITPTNATIGSEDGHKFYITFTPSAAGLQKGSIVFKHNAVSSPDTITASGIGNLVPVPLFSVTPTTINYGALTIGSTKKDSVLVSNMGTADLNVTAISSTNARFTFTPATMTLAPLGSAYLVIMFAPQDTSSQSGAIILTHNAVGSPDTINVSGYCTGKPVYAVSRTNVNMGSVLLNTLKTDTVTIWNKGTDTLKITGITSTNTQYSTSPTIRNIPPSGSLVDTIKFIPTTIGSSTAKILVASNDATTMDTINISGYCFGTPIYTVSRTNVSMGSVLLNTLKTDTVTIWNKGTDTLKITGITSTNIQYSTSPTMKNIPPSGSLVDTIKFIPTAIGSSTAKILIASNGVTTPDTIDVSGKGIIEVGVDGMSQIPFEFVLEQNYPNPFNPLTVIRFSVAKQGTTRLIVLNILGQEVATLFLGQADPGKMYSVQFNAMSFPSGIYFNVLESGGERQIKKMTIIK